MKKFIWVCVSIVIFLAAGSGFVFAQETNPEKPSTFVDFRNDYMVSQNGSGQYVELLMVWWQYKELGLVFEETYANKVHAICIKPSALWKIGKSLYLLGGLSTDSSGSDFVQTGAWYINNFGKFNVLADMRNYWSITGQNNGYTDNLFRFGYLPSKNFSVGIDAVYDHWWNGPAHDWFLIGPRVGYKITDTIGIYGRVSPEWDIRENNVAKMTMRYRAELTFSF